jgi:serine/threonine protein kinase
VQLWNVIIYNMKIVMVFEFCEQDLTGFLNARACDLTPLEVKQLLFQLLKGVEYLHKKQFWHRDLKPQNLLLTEVDPSVFSPKGRGWLTGLMFRNH